MKKNKHKGSCFCGNIQFEIKDTGGTVAACHCLDCRKSSGAPFMVFIVVEIDNYIIKSGNPGSIQYADGIKVRTFCKDCGSAISYENKNDTGTIDISTMLMEKPEDFIVKYHVWTKRQLPGIIIDENIQKFSEYSDLSEKFHGD
jgi:hypothetical protein